MSTFATFVQLPNGQWGIRIPTQITDDYQTCDLEPGTPVTIHKADSSIVEVKCTKHLGHHLYGGKLSCVYGIAKGPTRTIQAAPRQQTLRDLWETSK